jgi:hypothetical protein
MIRHQKMFFPSDRKNICHNIRLTNYW